MIAKDLKLSALLGFLSAGVGLVAYRIGGPLPAPALWSLLVFAPILFTAGLYISLWISRLNQAFYGLGKFVLVGIFNTVIDLAIFNVLIELFAADKGLWLVAFKSISFLAALINSYLWNKFWTFQKSSGAPRENEFAVYGAVTIIGFLINVGVTTVIANHTHPLAGLSRVRWDNAAALVATVASLLWNFLGYKLIVFKDG